MNLEQALQRISDLEVERDALLQKATFGKYQSMAARTLNPNLPMKESLSDYGLGLAGEAGEVIEPIKKYLFHGKGLLLDQMRDELGDVLWYLAAIATTLGLDLTVIAMRNIEKLAKRHPDGWKP